MYGQDFNRLAQVYNNMGQQQQQQQQQATGTAARFYTSYPSSALSTAAASPSPVTQQQQQQIVAHQFATLGGTNFVVTRDGTPLHLMSTALASGANNVAAPGTAPANGAGGVTYAAANPLFGANNYSGYQFVQQPNGTITMMPAPSATTAAAAGYAAVAAGGAAADSAALYANAAHRFAGQPYRSAAAGSTSATTTAATAALFGANFGGGVTNGMKVGPGSGGVGEHSHVSASGVPTPAGEGGGFGAAASVSGLGVRKEHSIPLVVKGDYGLDNLLNGVESGQQAWPAATTPTGAVKGLGDVAAARLVPGSSSAQQLPPPAESIAALMTYGFDPDKLGLALSEDDLLHPTISALPYDRVERCIMPDYHTPERYLKAKPQVLSMKLYNSFTELNLFYIFYSMPGDVLHIAAARCLYDRKWHYHKKLRFWCRPKQPPTGANPPTNADPAAWEIFDTSTWTIKSATKSFEMKDMERYETIKDRMSRAADSKGKTGASASASATSAPSASAKLPPTTATTPSTIEVKPQSS